MHKYIITTSIIMTQFWMTSSNHEAIPALKDSKNFIETLPGDIYIGNVMDVFRPDPITGQCGTSLAPSNCAWLSVLHQAIAEINARSDLLPNISLGLISFDTCRMLMRNLEAAIYFTTHPSSCSNSKLGSLVSGPRVIQMIDDFPSEIQLNESFYRESMSTDTFVNNYFTSSSNLGKGYFNKSSRSSSSSKPFELSLELSSTMSMETSGTWFSAALTTSSPTESSFSSLSKLETKLISTSLTKSSNSESLTSTFCITPTTATTSATTASSSKTMPFSSSGPAKEHSSHSTSPLPSINPLSPSLDTVPRSRVVGVTGPMSSSGAVLMSPLLGIYEIPNLGLLSTSDELSDLERYPYFYRLVAPDRYSVEGLLDVCVYFGWTYISVVYTDSAYGINGASQVDKLSRRKSYNICVAMSVKIPTGATDSDYESVMKELMTDEKARVIIAFIEYDTIDGLFPRVKRIVGNGKFIWLSGDGFTGYLDSNSQTFSDVLDGSMFMDHSQRPIPNSMEFVKSPKFWESGSTWARQSWQKAYNCSQFKGEEIYANSSGNYCTFDASKVADLCQFYSTWAGKDRMYDSVYVLAHAVHNVINSDCPQAFSDHKLLGDCLKGSRIRDQLMNLSIEGMIGHIAFTTKGDLIETYVVKQFQKDSSGIFKEVIVGYWNLTSGLKLFEDDLNWDGFQTFNSSNNFSESQSDQWNTSKLIPLESVCSKPCASNEYLSGRSSNCCWTCSTCRDNEIISENGTSCQSCPQFYWPDHKTPSKCHPIEPTYIHLKDPISIVMILFAVVGTAFSITVLIIYSRFKGHKLVKATSRSLCQVILMGTLMSAAAVVLFVAKSSTDWLCGVRDFTFHISINLIYAPLLVKNFRIYRIFTAVQQGGFRPSFTSNFWQMTFIVVIVIIQLIMTIVLELLTPSISALTMPTPYEPYVEIYCRHHSLHIFLIPLSYNIIIIIICTIIGFITRKLPDNFNESWFIFVSATTTLFAWAVFIPAYFTTFRAYLQSVILGFCLVLNCFITLACQFGPVLYAVAFVPNERIRFSAMTMSTANPSVVYPDSHSQRF